MQTFEKFKFEIFTWIFFFNFYYFNSDLILLISKIMQNNFEPIETIYIR